VLNKTLIVSYTFPPSPEIGGRRWAKFSKYLNRKSVPIKVITSKIHNAQNNWAKDITDIECKIERISFNYPYYLGIHPKTLFEKLMYKLSLNWSKLRTSGNYYDKSIHCKKRLLAKIEQYIKVGYKNIIVTVAPFHLATHISSLKTKYPKTNFIVDFRDPWLENETSYGYFTLSNSRKIFEQEAEKKVIESFDIITTVSNNITNDLKKKYPTSTAKFITIPNGFDKEDITFDVQHIESNPKDKIKLVFTGTFYMPAEKYLNKLCEWLDVLKTSETELYNNLSIEFYGKIHTNIKSIKRHGIIKLNGFVPINKIHKIISRSSACLLFLTDDINYSFSTKFCEYLAFKKPIIVISNNGPTGKYVDQNKIGNSLTINDSVDKLIDTLIDIRTNRKNYYQAYDIEQFNIKNITKKLLPLLK